MKSPTKKQILKARKKAKLTQDQAAHLVNRTTRVWQYWEAADREMPAEIWEVFLLRVSK